MQKLKYSLPIFMVLFLLAFSSLVYSHCPAFVQCSQEELRTNPVCVQACSLNFNIVLLVIIILVSYIIPAVLIHHHNR